MLGKFLLEKDTLGIEAATHRAVTIPAGTEIEVKVKPALGVQLVDVVCDGKEMIMFLSDLRNRSQRINVE